MKKIVSVLLVLFACIVFSGIAHAGSSTSNLQVSATVQDVCSVGTTGVDFGNIPPDGNLYFANGDVSVTCAPNTPYNIALDTGQNFITPTRNVTDGQNNYARYNLFKDDQLTLQWGDSDYANTYPNGSSLADTATGNVQPHTVYGRIVASVGEAAGSYSDNVVVTVYF